MIMRRFTQIFLASHYKISIHHFDFLSRKMPENRKKAAQTDLKKLFLTDYNFANRRLSSK